MSGGIAYIWDVNETLKQNFNPDMADLEGLTEKDKNTIKNLVEEPYRDWETDRKSTRLNSSHRSLSRMPSSA